MTFFVDASALVAIIAGEGVADALSDRMAESDDIQTSAIAIWEAVARLRKSHRLSIREARALVTDFAADHRFRLCEIGGEVCDEAIDAYAKYGKGRHPAALNMGDCFAYACAKVLKAGLLSKGDDFTQTDLRRGASPHLGT